MENDLENSSPRKLLFAGFKKTLPFQTGVIPFGVLYATLAINFGFEPWLVLFLSILVFGGSSQLVFIDLMSKLGSPFQAVLGANIVNARHLIYSAAVSKEFSKFSNKWKLILAYLLTDQLYAVFQKENESLKALNPLLKPWFYFGSGICTWILWIFSSGLGIFFGQIIPDSWNLSFSIPLMFMPLIFILAKKKADYFVALVAASLTIAFHSFPYGLGVFFAIVIASLLGYFIFKENQK
ncbi:MAG: AzlC family ABC transporter permease [Pseudobdellovibrionaceae bacterium]|jgi:4-azaleucine resistance transporter AzlC